MEGTFKPPRELIFEGKDANWKKFIQHFNIYMKATALETKDDETKIAIFLNLAGEEAVDIFNTFKLTNEQKKVFQTVIKEFEDYCVPRKNVVYDRFKFFTRSQTEETFDHFLTDLRMLAKECNFGDQEESLIRDRIVIGTSDASLQERLLRVADLSLTTAINQCRAAEAGKIQAKTLQDRTMEVAGIKKYNTSKSEAEKFNIESKSTVYKCNKCFKRHKYRECPAYGKKCAKCSKFNHFAITCTVNDNHKIQQRRKVHEVNTEGMEADYEETFELNTVADSTKTLSLNNKISRNSKNNQQWMEKIIVSNMFIDFKLDTGAECNVLPKKYFDIINENNQNMYKLETTSVILLVYGGKKVSPVGTVRLNSSVKAITLNIKFMVVDTDSNPILGLTDCIKFNLIKRVEGIEQKIQNNKVNKSNFINNNSHNFSGLGKVGQYKIKLKGNAEPIIKPIRRVPESIKEKLKETLDELERKEVIAKVSKPIEWCHNLVIVEKPNKTLRLCLDPKELNNNIMREHFPIPSPDEISSRLAGKQVFSVLDMKDGFFQVELEDSSSYICTFGTPYGRYRFKRMPFGISTAPEVFQKINTKIFGDIRGVEVYFDDIIVAGENNTDHDDIMKVVMKRAKENNVKFNVNKLQYKIPEVKYVGIIISKHGIKADPEQIETILKLERPKNVKELQKLLGMTNYLSKFIPNYSNTTTALRELLKKNIEWIWNTEQEQAFQLLKHKLSCAPTLRLINNKLPITIQTDSSKSGLGGCILQQGQPISFYSRSLTTNQERWAPIEKEMYAICATVEKYHQFIYGRRVIIETDHKPLITIVKKDINKVSSRLQRMLLKLLKYDLDIRYVPGSKLYVADFLSRNFIKTNACDDPSLLEVVHCVEKELPISEERLKQFKNATLEDNYLNKILNFYQNGWPNSANNLFTELKALYKLRHEIHVKDGIIYYNDRVIVPNSLRTEMLNLIHDGHMGITKCKSRARQILYWPGMSTDIEKLITSCKICEKFQYSNVKEPLIPHELPKLPFNKIGIDICYFSDANYLVLVDYLTKWIEVKKLKFKTADEIILKLKEIFSVHGIPESIVCDNMPFNSFKFKSFANKWDIKIINSSPRYPKANGQAEKAVGIVKRMMKKCKESNSDFYTALLNYRNTPVCGLSEYSPAQMLMSRLLRSKLPCRSNMLEPSIIKDVKKQLENKKQHDKYYYDRSTKPERLFQKEENVLIQDLPKKTWTPGKVVEVRNEPRSYTVQTENGSVLRRNSHHIRPSRNTVEIKHDAASGDEESIENIPEVEDKINNTQKCNPDNIVRSAFGRQIRKPNYLKDYVH